MKSYGALFGQVTDFGNLLHAAKRAARGKRQRRDVYEYMAELEGNLLELQRELEDGLWAPGPYRDFTVRDPKTRLVSAAPFPDRVVHHAVCQVIEPLWERRFIDDTFACRLRKGAHRAADRYTEFCRGAAYVLKCDISRYFEHIRHDVLLSELGHLIRDRRLLELLAQIVNSNDRRGGEAGRGIPIGNLTSQFFANVYLDRFDHWVKEELRCRRYIRYVDDFVLLHDDKQQLWNWLEMIEARLGAIGLTVHPRKRTVTPVTDGCDFMGFRIWPDHRRLRPTAGYRSRRKLVRAARLAGAGRLPPERLRASVWSWLGHVRHGDTCGLRRQMLTQVRANCGTGPLGQTAFCAAVAGTTTTTTTAQPTATTTTRTTRTTTTGSVLPASLPGPGLASRVPRRAGGARPDYRPVPVLRTPPETNTQEAAPGVVPEHREAPGPPAVQNGGDAKSLRR